LWQRPEAEAVIRRSYLPRNAVWRFLRESEKLTAIERADLEQITSNCLETAQLYRLAQGFRQLIVHRQAEALDSWMEQARASSVPEVCRFAESLQSALLAIRAALRYPWSSGQVEGQIKAIKRQMYGRAKFPLLARHVLLTA
jgi:transposase